MTHGFIWSLFTGQQYGTLSRGVWNEKGQATIWAEGPICGNLQKYWQAPGTPRLIVHNHVSLQREYSESTMTSIYQESRLCFWIARCLHQDGRPVPACLSYLSAYYVGIRWPATVTSTYKVWRIAPSARVSGSALLWLRFSFRGAVSPVSAAAFLTPFAAAGLTLSITLVVLWVVSSTGRAPPSGIAPIAVPVCGILTPLDCNASWAGDICGLCSLCTQDFLKEMLLVKLWS